MYRIRDSVLSLRKRVGRKEKSFKLNRSFVSEGSFISEEMEVPGWIIVRNGLPK